MKELSNKQIANEITLKSKCLIEGVIYAMYPLIVESTKTGTEEEKKLAKKHLKVKHYQALDRIKMYLATKVAKTSFYDFDLELLVKKKNRKLLKALHAEIDGITYQEIRDIWHESLKDIFFQQKEMSALSEKLSKVAVVARMEIGEEQGFVSIQDGEIKVVKSPVDATEFVAISDNDEALNLVKNFIFKEFSWECRVFFTNKIDGRHIYSW